MHKIYIGFDERQVVAYTVCAQSIIQNSSKGNIQIIPLRLNGLPIVRVGLTPFTYARFMVPFLQDYQGWALFLDSDIVVRTDIDELFLKADNDKKMIIPEASQKFERAAVMLMNCSRLRELTAEFVSESNQLHTLSFMKPEDIGWVDKSWNHCVGYDVPNADAKLVHFTQGIPAHPELRECEFAGEWLRYHQLSNSTAPWGELMGKSVHARWVGTVPVPRLVFDKYVQDTQNVQKG